MSSLAYSLNLEYRPSQGGDNSQCPGPVPVGGLLGTGLGFGLKVGGVFVLPKVNLFQNIYCRPILKMANQMGVQEEQVLTSPSANLSVKVFCVRWCCGLFEESGNLGACEHLGFEGFWEGCLIME